MLPVLLPLLLLARIVAAEECAASPPQAEDARKLFLDWVGASSVPGAYSTPAERAAVSDHPGDLTHTRIFQEHGPHSATGQSGRPWPHTKPNPIFEDDPAARERMLEAVAWLLRRGMSRLQDTVLRMFDEVAMSEAGHLLALARRALDSFEDFWRSVRWTVAYGKRQTEWHVAEEMKEYGPETNFWLKFRPTLTCSHAPRLGPELGGAKTWCNPHAWPSPPRYILSAGAGDDMLYETIAAKVWPGVTIVTPDCYQYNEEVLVTPPSWNGSSMLLMPVCVTGEDEGYVRLAPPHLRSRFVTLPEMLKGLRERYNLQGFDFIKCNIEASEYPLFAHVMRDVDSNLRGTAQINIEMHRMGMHDYAEIPPSGGRDFNSLLFMQLLWATFLSGGYHPVFVEKWHDKNAAADVVWVNQTWWLEGELEAVRSIWTRSWPDVPLSEATFPDAASLARKHAAGKDPYRAPSAARSVARKQKANEEHDAEPEVTGQGTGNGVLTLSSKKLRALEADAAPALMMVEPPSCQQCAELAPIWEMIAANIHQVTGYDVPTFRVSCAKRPKVCTLLNEKADEPIGAVGPVFGVWNGARFERYAGEKQPQALVQWLGQQVQQAQIVAAYRAAGVGAPDDRRSSKDKRDAVVDKDGLGKGRWAQLPIEIVEELSVSSFLSRYVDQQRPVILRRQNRPASVELPWLRANCGDGTIHVFEHNPQSVAWGGFGGPPEPTTLRSYLDRVAKDGQDASSESTSFSYAFDLKAACDCAALLDSVSQLAYFADDGLPFDDQLPFTNWPSLIVGPPLSSSALHVDSAFLPFWLTLLSGEKRFRLVTLDDWRSTLATESSGGGALYDYATGKNLQPVNAYDDGFVERELLGRGATVWNGTIEVGDTVYVPTGALHGALNLRHGGHAVALSSNYLDAAHAPQVSQHYCLKQPPNDRAANPVCARLGLLPSYGDRASAAQQATKSDSGGPKSRSEPFWHWLLGRPDWCARYANGARSCPGATERCPSA